MKEFGDIVQFEDAGLEGDPVEISGDNEMDAKMVIFIFQYVLHSNSINFRLIPSTYKFPRRKALLMISRRQPNLRSSKSKKAAKNTYRRCGIMRIECRLTTR